MENTLENKAIFFALYWGQEVYAFSKEHTVGFTSLTLGDSEKLRLKSLSDITDEDAYNVGKLINCWSRSERKQSWFLDDEMKGVHIAGGKLFAAAIGKEYGHGMSHPFANNSTDILAAYDCLRSKGYVLPFNGVSVEELVGYGWVELEKLI